MNIKGLSNHIHFQKIFELNKNEDGSYNWIKIAQTPNLPLTFIDKYFFQINKYKIEKYQTLSPYIIKKYGNYLNWNILLYSHNIPENLIEQFLNRINWHILIKTQKLSLNFLKKYKDKISINDLSKNFEINDEIKQEFISSLE